MADVITMLADLINPQVMADYIDTNLVDNIAFADLAEIDTTLVGTDGDTITLPKYQYIGDATDVGEGVDIETANLTASTISVTVKKAAKGVAITDEAALSGYGDPIGELNRQLMMSMAQKLDTDCKASLDTIGAGMTVDKQTETLSASVIADALTKFGEAQDGTKVLLINPAQLAQLRKDPDYMNASDVATNLLINGSVGMIWGCNIVLKNKIIAEAGVYTNYIVKPGALRIYLKRDTNVEPTRIAKNKTTEIYADKIYTTYLYDESKAIKLLTME